MLRVIIVSQEAAIQQFAKLDIAPQKTKKDFPQLVLVAWLPCGLTLVVPPYAWKAKRRKHSYPLAERTEQKTRVRLLAYKGAAISCI